MTFCREEILRDLAEPPGADWTARALAHARGCERCADLLPFLEPLPVEATSDRTSEGELRGLLDGVVAATSGAGGCEAARDRLAARDPSAAVRRPDPTLDAHVGRCAGCAAFARALAAVDATLPAALAVDPGPAFTAAVLRRTSRAPERAGFAAAIAARLERSFGRLLARPRFALEFAYAGALLVWLVAGAAGLSLATPARWLTEEPTEAFRRVGQELEALPVGRVDAVVSLDPVREDLRARYSGTEPLRRDLADSRRAFAAALTRGDFSGAGAAASELAGGIVRLPGRFLQGRGDATDAAPRDGSSEESSEETNEGSNEGSDEMSKSRRPR